MIINNQLLPFVLPETLIAPIRGADKDKGHRLQITAIIAVRLAVALGIYKCATRMKADSGRVSFGFGAVLSAPGAGLFWGGKFLYKGAQEIKKGLADRAIKRVGFGAATWVGGCLAIQLSQTVTYRNYGYRWGALEVITQRISKDIEYRGWKGF